MPVKHLLICFYVLMALPSYAQEAFVRGKLLDAQTQEPVAFATIRIQGYALGVISNSDGGFRIPQRFQDYSDILEISSMGYQRIEVRISGLSKENINIIELGPGVLELEEAVVEGKRRKRLSARRIVRKAIENIPYNYPSNAFSTVGYYRDYQLNEGRYLNLNEAILEAFDQGFDSYDNQSTKVRIYDYKENRDFERDTVPQQPYNYKSGRKIINNAFLRGYGGNEFTILRIHDALRNYKVDSYSFVNRFDVDFLRNHYFRKKADTYLDDRRLYTIGVRKRFPDFVAKGTLYISKDDFAIHKMEYSVHEFLRPPEGAYGKKELNERLTFEITTEYQEQYGKMYLNYISFHNSFLVREPPEFLVDAILVNSQKKCFEVSFTKEPNEEDAQEYRNYTFTYKNKKLKFSSVVLLEKQVWLYPEMKDEKDELIFREIGILARKNSVDRKLLRIKIENIRDIEGNTLNTFSYRDFNQFREFFVQQVKPNTPAPIDTLFMKKNRPIFKDQPIIRPDNFGDYWMNTPLRKISE